MLYYTRAGNFSINNTGNLVTSDGFLHQSADQHPAERHVGVDRHGWHGVGDDARQHVADADRPAQRGALSEPGRTENQGRNLYSQTLASGSPIQTPARTKRRGLIRQGFLEGSNVDVVAEMVNLILAQRAYEFNTKAITTADQMLSFTTNLIR